MLSWPVTSMNDSPQQPSAENTNLPHRGVGLVFIALLAFLPISFYLGFFTQQHTATFVTAILAIIPLARLIGYATKELTLQTNPAFGGLINATFGNLIELTIAILALQRGLRVVVQASIIGSIMGNILLLTGLSIFFGGLRYKEQTFNKESAGVSSTMLIISVVGVTLPTVFALTVNTQPGQIQLLSDAVAIVLALIYFAGLIFAFFTHKHLFDASDEIRATNEAPALGIRSASLLLLGCTVAVGIASELLVRDVEKAAEVLGLTQTFVGVVVIAIITNIAEKANAIHFAMKNQLDISLEIGLSSAIQIALFVVPTLVLVSHVQGYDFTMVFSPFEVISVIFAVMIVNYLSADGKCNWLEGAQLVTVYVITAIAYFFI
jgi:Ca2+:H+ antiporter